MISYNGAVAALKRSRTLQMIDAMFRRLKPSPLLRRTQTLVEWRNFSQHPIYPFQIVNYDTYLDQVEENDDEIVRYSNRFAGVAQTYIEPGDCGNLATSGDTPCLMSWQDEYPKQWSRSQYRKQIIDGTQPFGYRTEIVEVDLESPHFGVINLASPIASPIGWMIDALRANEYALIIGYTPGNMVKVCDTLQSPATGDEIELIQYDGSAFNVREISAGLGIIRL